MKSATSMKAVKWLGMDQDGRMTVSPVTASNVLQSMPKNRQVNLISIFGAARQGKSFLMNLLANQQDLFRISNEKEPCTQGVDLSSHFMPLESFSKINGCEPVSSDIHIGFVDAEGQGDRDITYDSRLVSPVLLSSKVVIFNWKDSLQADRMLNLLAVLAKAAQNVELAEGESRKLFGHLHIVFRDWNFVNSKPSEVYDTLFKKEKGGTQEMSNRNLARLELVEAFESINIWLFPLPVATTSQLSERIRFEQLQPQFQHKLREFRTVVSKQLQQPMIFNQQPLTGYMLAEIMPFFAESLNDNRVIMPESIYSSMRRAEGKRMQTKAEEAMQIFATEQLAKTEVISTEELSTFLSKTFQAIIIDTMNRMKNFPEDVQIECQSGLKTFSSREIELASKSNNEKLLKLFQSILNNASDEMEASFRSLESQLPLSPDDLEHRCEGIINKAKNALTKCPKSSLVEYDNDNRRLEQQGNILKERLQNMNERAIRSRWSRIQGQMTACKNELKAKGNKWLDSHIVSKKPFTVSMLEGELRNLRSTFEMDPASPDLDSFDINEDLDSYHSQVLEDLKRQYTLHVRHILVEYISQAKSKIDNEMQAIVLPMPREKLHIRIQESMERVVVEIANEMQGWSFPQKDMENFGKSVAEYTEQIEAIHMKKNDLASQDNAARKAASQYNDAKDLLIKQLHTTITKSIPMNEESLNEIYQVALMETSRKLCDGDRKKESKILQSLRADLSTTIEQLKTINMKENEKNLLKSAAEKERQRLKSLTEKVHEAHANAAQQEKEMTLKYQKMEKKSIELKNELSTQEIKKKELEIQLQEWQEKSKLLQEEKLHVENKAKQMATKERQTAQRIVNENMLKQQQLQAELNAIQNQLEKQQRILKEKERESREAEDAKEKARKLAQEKERALEIAKRERALREKLSEDVLLHQEEKAQLETKISTVMLEKTLETRKLQGILTSEQERAQELESELQRLRNQALALDQEKEHWRRQVLAMEESKHEMVLKITDESARREVAEVAAQQAANAAEVAARAAIQALEASPGKKRKTEKSPPLLTSAKKSKKTDSKTTKMSLQEAKQAAKEELDKRISERIAKMKK